MHAFPVTRFSGALAHPAALWALACALLAGVSLTTAAHASPLLPADHPAHQVVSAWVARGLLPTAIPHSRPLTWGQLERLLSEATPATDADRRQRDRLHAEARLHAPGHPYAELALTASLAEGEPLAYPPPPLPADSGGPVTAAVGGAAFAERWGGEIAARLEHTGRVTAVLAPHRMLGNGEGGHPVLQEGYLAAHAGPLWLAAGHQPIIWGPGIDGGFLLTANAAPLPALRVRSDTPHRFGGRLGWLGSAGFDLFFARLEKDRAVPHPVLAGLRIDWLPHRRLSIGLSRTVMAGGRGQSLSGTDLWTILTGGNRQAGADTSNSIAGIDLALTLPAGGTRALRLYAEYAGEDESNAWPTKPALRGGLLLAGLGAGANHTLRAELAATDVAYDAPPGGVWYRHGLYASGYTFHGRILGDEIGPDGRRGVLAWRSDSARVHVEVALHGTVTGFSTATPTKRRQLFARWNHPARNGLTWEVCLGAGTRRTGGKTRNESLAMIQLHVAMPAPTP